jgi:hypothetical protein
MADSGRRKDGEGIKGAPSSLNFERKAKAGIDIRRNPWSAFKLYHPMPDVR